MRKFGGKNHCFAVTMIILEIRQKWSILEYFWRIEYFIKKLSHKLLINDKEENCPYSGEIAVFHLNWVTKRSVSSNRASSNRVSSNRASWHSVASCCGVTASTCVMFLPEMVIRNLLWGNHWRHLECWSFYQMNTWSQLFKNVTCHERRKRQGGYFRLGDWRDLMTKYSGWSLITSWIRRKTARTIGRTFEG